MHLVAQPAALETLPVRCEGRVVAVKREAGESECEGEAKSGVRRETSVADRVLVPSEDDTLSVSAPPKTFLRLPVMYYREWIDDVSLPISFGLSSVSLAYLRRYPRLGRPRSPT
jgi:hypothetical protein